MKKSGMRQHPTSARDHIPVECSWATSKNVILALTKTDEEKGPAMDNWKKSGRSHVNAIKLIGLFVTVALVIVSLMAVPLLIPKSYFCKKGIIVDSKAQLIRGGNGTMEWINHLANEVGSPRLPDDQLLALMANGGICSSAVCRETAEILLHSINFSIDPCTNFYDFACGQKLEQISTFPNQILQKSQKMNEILAENLKKPLNGPEDSMPVAKAKVFYQQCIDTTKLESIGLAPFQEHLAKYGGWPIIDRPAGRNGWVEEKFNWLEIVAYLRREFGISALIDVQVRPDMKSMEKKHVITIDQPSLIIPREKLIPLDQNIATIYKRYLRDVTSVFLGRVPFLIRRTYYRDLIRDVQDVLNFEIQLAEASTPEEDRDENDNFTSSLMYNMKSVDSYQIETAMIENGKLEELNWKQFLNNIFQSTGITLTGTEELIVREPSYFKKLIPLLKKTSKRVLANYLGFRLVHAMAEDTTQELRDYRQKFNEDVIGLGDISESRETTCTHLAMKHFESALIKLLDKQLVVKVQEIFVNIRTVLHDLLTPSGFDHWVAPSTVKRIQNQLADTQLVIGSAGPTALTEEIVEDFYANLKIDLEDEYFSNVMHLVQWESERNLKKIGTPLAKELSKSPIYVTGIISPIYIKLLNAIVLPGGILQEPFFHTGAPDYLNYAGFGQSIGHELAHGFLNSEISNDNNHVSWWTNDNSAHYKAKAQCFQQQYDAFEPLPGLHINGQLTLNENMADNLGLLLAFKAYEKAMEQQNIDKENHGRLPGLEQFCQNQLFFLAHANMLCEEHDASELEQIIKSSIYSPNKYRVLGTLKNSKEFASAFLCPVGSCMNPKEKCTFW